MTLPPTAISTIRREHNAIGAVLDVLQKEMARAEPDRGLLDQILTYLISFSAVLHHPKEERFLHTILRQRDPAQDAVLTKVEEEHAKGALLLQELRAALGKDGDLTAFRQKALLYADFEMRHMEREESQLLEAALRVLTAVDWAEMDAAFSASDEPLMGPEPSVRFAQLRDRILKFKDGK